MHGALRVNARCVAIRAVHDPLLECAPRDKVGAFIPVPIRDPRLISIQRHHCKGLQAIPRAHSMTIDQNRFVSVTIHNIGVCNIT